MILQRRIWLASKVVRLLMVGLLVSGLGAQVSETRPAFGYPEDWTHHRMKFTLPGLQQHPEIFSREPRAIHQIYRQWQAHRAPVAGVSAPALETPSESHPDWSTSLGSGRVAFGQFPAKWTTDPTATPSCMNDYVVFALNVTNGAAGGQPTLIGFNNLYSGSGSSLCGMTGPTVKFAYYTNSQFQGANTTSPVLSLDGTKVAFVESHAAQGGNQSTTSWLHVVTLGTTGNNGTLTAAAIPGTGNNASELSLLYASATNTRSAPWVDYASDTLYVCADNATLYAIHPVFSGGTPVVVKRIALGSSLLLTGPVFDSTTGNLYVGGSGGRLYVVNVNSATPTVHSLAVGSGTPNVGIYDSPIFDSTGSRVLAISANGVNSQGTGNSAVIVQAQADATGTSLSEVARVNVGLGASGGTATVTLYMGDFDNAYFTNPATGHMLVCGTGPADTTPYRYLLNFDAAGVIQPGTSAQIVNNANARCGPVSEYFNPNLGVDFFMWGVTTSNCGFAGHLPFGCVMSFQNESTIKATLEMGGTSGIIIDNDSTAAQASSIYFSTEGASGGTYSAVKLGQLNLN